MKIAVLKEVKTREARVALIPDNVRLLRESGHEVLVQKNAGLCSGYADADYVRAGGAIHESTRELLDRSDLVVKVKEPTIEEVRLMHADQIFFGFLHLAPIPDTLKAILDQRIYALGYETLQLADGRLPLLSPMSEIAGRLATQTGAHFLRFDQGGRGVLIGGTKSVKPAKVLVIGAGTVGQNAADVAIGMGGDTTLLDISESLITRLRQEKYHDRCRLEVSTPEMIARLVPESDLIIGGVLICGERAPKLVTESMVKKMRPGSVIIDVSVDQGGCVETSEVTSHEQPIVIKHGVLHYGVPNMPGSVPFTSTLALNHASFPYIKALADLGLEGACQKYPEMRHAINCAQGKIVHPALFSS